MYEVDSSDKVNIANFHCYNKAGCPVKSIPQKFSFLSAQLKHCIYAVN